jgi:hypothetical protein
MKPTERGLARLIREFEEARLAEPVLEASGDDVLEGARTASQAIELHIRKATDGQAVEPHFAMQVR